MKHTYQLTGMTCSSCESKVKSILLSQPDILAAEVSLANQEVSVEMSSHVPTKKLQEALGGAQSKYQISEIGQVEHSDVDAGFFQTYKPVLLLFLYISIISYFASSGDLMAFMHYFMSGFFLSFSFFKLINLKGFAESYAMYDVVAKRFSSWGYIYAFLELGLGIAFLINFNPFLTNLVTFLVMSVSIIGVLQSVLNKRKIQCACLGAVFNLPMSTLTIIEDAIMIAMSGLMLFWIS